LKDDLRRGIPGSDEWGPISSGLCCPFAEKVSAGRMLRVRYHFKTKRLGQGHKILIRPEINQKEE